jgi:hypothetical protein
LLVTLALLKVVAVVVLRRAALGKLAMSLYVPSQ